MAATAEAISPQRAPRRAKNKPVKTNEAQLRSFKPAVSHPTRALDIKLQTHLAQDLYNAQFARAHVALYNVIVMCNEIGEPHVAEELRDVVNSMIDQVGEDIDAEVARLRELRDQRPSLGLPTMTAPLSASVEVTTPQALRLLARVLTPLDALLLEDEAAWFDGAIDEAERKAHQFEWKHKVAHLLTDIVQLQPRSLESVRRRKAAQVAAKEAKEAQRRERRRQREEGESASFDGADSESGEILQTSSVSTAPVVEEASVAAE